MEVSSNIDVELIKLVFGWSINQVSGIFALESQLGEVPLIMRFILLLCTLANLGISSGQEWESSPIFYRRPYLLSSYYLLEIPQTNGFFVHSLSSLCFAELTILAGYHLSWGTCKPSGRYSTDACCSTPFVGGLSHGEVWFCLKKTKTNLWLKLWLLVVTIHKRIDLNRIRPFTLFRWIGWPP